ncbi:hypothetical protein HH214_09460 [Mucilaginibacter robiniae]|uniref:Uncharacterized protein n=1 Tax=Mucilaginibacter robiniae TaxID=2728022 RepID=A0A7L5E6R3_9SPHI|nr:hypothetical protein [Mucilaginibacter robiniae]QJD96086.1 hypothetical protein HH214_09460 [Mucilaginibacter robiniae]
MMKRTAVIGLAAFYLLLTTGMFVCVVHCMAENVFAHRQHMAGMARSTNNQHSQKPCKGGKGCSCCDQHGTYIVKENIKPPVGSLPFHLEFLSVGLSAYPENRFDFSFQSRINLWTDSHAPPGPSGKDYLIQIRTLLI